MTLQIDTPKFWGFMPIAYIALKKLCIEKPG